MEIVLVSTIAATLLISLLLLFVYSVVDYRIIDRLYILYKLELWPNKQNRGVVFTKAFLLNAPQDYFVAKAMENILAYWERKNALGKWM